MFLKFNCSHFGIKMESLRPDLKTVVAEKRLPSSGLAFGESMNTVISLGSDKKSPLPPPTEF